jgi:DNA polymerase-1
VACLANDEAMIKSFENGEDIHARTASEIFGVTIKEVSPGQRRIAKAVNFGIVYGQTPFGLSQALGIETSKAAEYINHYFEVHKGIKNYVNKRIE